MMLVTYSTMASAEPGVATPSIPGIVKSAVSLVWAVSVVVSSPTYMITASRSSSLSFVVGFVTGSKSGRMGKG
jgi:hypothetical protein